MASSKGMAMLMSAMSAVSARRRQSCRKYRPHLEDVENPAGHASIIDARPARLIVRQMRFKTRPGVTRKPREIKHDVAPAPRPMPAENLAILTIAWMGPPPESAGPLSAVHSEPNCTHSSLPVTTGKSPDGTTYERRPAPGSGSRLLAGSASIAPIRVISAILRLKRCSETIAAAGSSVG